MALKSATDRYNKWVERFQTAESQSCSPIMFRLMQTVTMPARVQQQFASLAAMEDNVRAVLDQAGVSIILVGQYLNFGRQVWKLKERFSGETANMECANLIALWVARGLTQSVLESIRSDVFGLQAPAGP